MSRKQMIRNGLEFARNYTTNLFDKFDAADEWVRQPADNTNHALWCAGHLARTDDFAIGMIDPQRGRDPEGYQALFGMGSQPSGSVADYPAAGEVLEYFQERRATLLELLDGLSEEDLDRATPDSAPDFTPTLESVFRLLIWHEGLHAGQASVAHRALGKTPVMG